MRGSSESGAGLDRFSDGPLVGRGALMEELVAAADAASQGGGSIVVLTGEAGIGKTSVARALGRQLRDQLEVSWGACVAGQSAPPFWPWRALVGLDPSDEPSQPADQAVGAPRFERLTALRDQLSAQAAKRPRLHVIEDLQWADVASVLLLADLGSAIVDLPFLVVATIRTGERGSSQLEDAIEQVRRIARVRQLAGAPGRRRRCADPWRGRRARRATWSPRCMARTGGNPLFVSELLRAMQVLLTPGERLRSGDRERAGPGDGLGPHRLGRLPSPVADALMTAAVIGTAGDAATLAAAHRCDVESLVDLLDQARAAHLLDAAVAGRWQFRHQLIRDAVYASVTGSDLLAVTSTCWRRWPQTRSTAPSAVAHHALAALPLFDADRAVAFGSPRRRVRIRAARL